VNVVIGPWSLFSIDKSGIARSRYVGGQLIGWKDRNEAIFPGLLPASSGKKEVVIEFAQFSPWNPTTAARSLLIPPNQMAGFLPARP
jgi:hypothetical protein